MRCYSCDEEITNQNKSIEHVIPNALGGKLKLNKGLCKKRNQKFSETIDAELIKQFHFIPEVIDADRDRKKNSKGIELVNKHGTIKKVGPYLNPKPDLHLKLTNVNKQIFARNEEHLDKLAKQHGKNLKRKGVEVTLERVKQKSSTDKYYFQNYLSRKPGEVGFGGDDFFRAISKIALNFLLLKRANSEYSNRIIDFINGEGSTERPAYFYYPSHYIPHEVGEKEISHLLYLKGDSSMAILYCYVELFNLENCLVTLNEYYNGKDFEETYCLDLIAKKEISKKVRIKLIKQHFKDLEVISSSKAHIKNHEFKYNELLRKIDLLQIQDMANERNNDQGSTV